MLFHSLTKTARAYPDKTGLVLGSSGITYAELLGRVARFMDRLRAMNVGEGDCIALVLPNSIEFVVSFYALAGLRVIALPLNPSSKVEELKYYLTDNEVKGIITNTERSELCRQSISAIEKDIALIIAGESNETITLPQDTSTMNLDAIYAPFDGPVIYQYSSGSTGRAKKVCRTQRNLAYETEAYIDATHMTSLDTVLCVVPLFHAHGLGKCMLAPVATGATLVMLEPVTRDSVTVEVPFLFRTQRVFELIKREKVTILPATPYISGALAETPEDVQVDVSTLRLCLSGGNFLPEEVFTRFKQRFGIPLRSIYGSTETGSVALNMEPDEAVRFDSVGRPSGNIEVRITNGTLEELPAGSIGEIAVKSEAMAGGYLNMPELNREVFRDGFYFTGDLGKKDEQGRLYITGRKKIFIESGGEKVDPLEIEQVLQTHPAIKEAAVVGIAGPYGGQAIKAVIVLNNTEGAAKNLASMELEILLHCKERLSDYKIPRVVEFREALPKSSLGKILRKDLIEGSGLPGRPGSSSAGDNRIRASILEDGEGSAEKFLEVRIREQLASMLKVDIAEIDAQRPLGEFGLGSLMAVELRNWLEGSLELTLPVTILWSYPTARDLASHLVAMLRRSINLQPSGPVDGTGEQASGTKDDAASRALAEIERLSEAEVQQQIDALTREDWKDDRGGNVRNSDLSSYASQIEQMSDVEIRQLLTRETPESEARREVENSQNYPGSLARISWHETNRAVVTQLLFFISSIHRRLCSRDCQASVWQHRRQDLRPPIAPPDLPSLVEACQAYMAVHTPSGARLLVATYYRDWCSGCQPAGDSPHAASVLKGLPVANHLAVPRVPVGSTVHEPVVQVAAGHSVRTVGSSAALPGWVTGCMSPAPRHWHTAGTSVDYSRQTATSRFSFLLFLLKRTRLDTFLGFNGCGALAQL